jgi:hypothetical protein
VNLSKPKGKLQSQRERVQEILIEMERNLIENVGEKWN